MTDLESKCASSNHAKHAAQMLHLNNYACKAISVKQLHDRCTLMPILGFAMKLRL